MLIRSVEPLEGVDKMVELRQGKKKSSTPSKGSLKVRDLGNGPSKLCQSLNITKPALNQRDLVGVNRVWVGCCRGVGEGYCWGCGGVYGGGGGGGVELQTVPVLQHHQARTEPARPGWCQQWGWEVGGRLVIGGGW